MCRLRESSTVCWEPHRLHSDLVNVRPVVAPRLTVRKMLARILLNRHIPVGIPGCRRPIIPECSEKSPFILSAWVQYNWMVQRRNIRYFSQTSGASLIPSCICLLGFRSSLKVGIPAKDILLCLRSIEVRISLSILINRNIRNRRLLLLECLL